LELRHQRGEESLIQLPRSPGPQSPAAHDMCMGTL
jgi:hypothetical protein